MRPLSIGLRAKPISLDARAMAAVKRSGGAVLLSGAATPVLGPELIPSSDLNSWVSGGAFGNWNGTTATTNTVTTTGANGARRVRLPCTPGATYWLSGKVIGGTGPGSVAIAFGTSAAVYITHKDESFVSGGVTSTLLVAPANAAFIEFMVRGGNTGQTCMFSELRAGEFIGYTYGTPPARNFFDSSGTDIIDGVTQMDNPVGLALDATGTSGPELFTGAYLTGTSTTATYAGAEATVTFGGHITSSGANWLYTPAPVVSAGAFVTVAFDAQWVSGGDLQSGCGWTLGLTITAAANGGVKRRYVTTVAAGFLASPPATFGSPVAGAVWKITVISIKQTTGSHANQGAVGSKPALRKGPLNQLLWSGDFSNAVWTKLGATADTGQTDPLGGTSAVKLVETAVNNGHYFLQSAVNSFGTASSAWIVKPAGRTKIRIRSEAPQAGSLATNFDLANGTIQAGTGSIAAIGNGFYLCVATTTVNGTGAMGYHLMQTVSDAWAEAYMGDGTSGVIVYRAGLYQGTVTAQQIIDAGGIPLTTTAPASSARGSAWWQFDTAAPGDYLGMGIQTGETGWIAAAVTFGAAATANETIFANGAGSANLKGVWLLRNGGTGENFMRMGVGNGVNLDMVTAYALPLRNVPRVVEGGWDASSVFVGVDGNVVSAPRTGSATPAPNTPMIGAYSPGNHHLNGALHAQVICPVVPPAQDRDLIRRWLASRQWRRL